MELQVNDIYKKKFKLDCGIRRISLLLQYYDRICDCTINLSSNYFSPKIPHPIIQHTGVNVLDYNLSSACSQREIIELSHPSIHIRDRD